VLACLHSRFRGHIVSKIYMIEALFTCMCVGMATGSLAMSTLVLQIVKNAPKSQASSQALMTRTESIEIPELNRILLHLVRTGQLRRFRKENAGRMMNWYKAVR